VTATTVPRDADDNDMDFSIPAALLLLLLLLPLLPPKRSSHVARLAPALAAAKTREKRSPRGWRRALLRLAAAAADSLSAERSISSTVPDVRPSLLPPPRPFCRPISWRSMFSKPTRMPTSRTGLDPWTAIPNPWVEGGEGGDAGLSDEEGDGDVDALMIFSVERGSHCRRQCRPALVMDGAAVPQQPQPQPPLLRTKQGAPHPLVERSTQTTASYYCFVNGIAADSKRSLSLRTESNRT
jgi:hypothetical protein